jgi:hypothetical protein
MNEHTNISNKVSRCPNEMSDFYSASLRHTQRLCCNTARTNETQRDERTKERRRRSRWGGWAPRGWWSPRSARSRGTGPCWMPASDPRSSLRSKPQMSRVRILEIKRHARKNFVRLCRPPHLCLPSRCHGRLAPTPRGSPHPDRATKVRGRRCCIIYCMIAACCTYVSSGMLFDKSKSLIRYLVVVVTYVPR